MKTNGRPDDRGAAAAPDPVASAPAGPEPAYRGGDPDRPAVPLQDLVRVSRSEMRQLDGPLPLNFIVLPDEHPEVGEVGQGAARGVDRPDVAAFGAAPAPRDTRPHEAAARPPVADRAPPPPQEDRMPVLTVRAETPADAFGERRDDAWPSEPFTPAVFGPKLQHPEEPALHADPESAPASLAVQRHGGDARGRRWPLAPSIVVLLALLAAAGWWWFDRHGVPWAATEGNQRAGRVETAAAAAAPKPPQPAPDAGAAPR